MNKTTDGGLVALAGAGVGPGLEHLEFRRESPDFSSVLSAVRLLFSLLPFQFCIDCSVDFLVYLLVSKWVGGYQVAVLPEGVVFCCEVASVLKVRLGV